MKELKETLQKRGSEYGDFSKVAFTAQTLKTVLANKEMTKVQRECLDLICTKLARIAHGNPSNKDSWLDIAGYAQLVVLDLDRTSGV